MTQPDPIKIFATGPLEQVSEQTLLRSLVDRLRASDLGAVILTNFHLDGRQIDLVVATDDGAALVEVKSTNLPIRGEINGPWERLSISGMWTPFRNAYQQALDGKNRLRDLIASKADVGSYYPAGFVAFVGDLPAESNLTSGNFKVLVGCADDFLGALGALRGSPLSLAQWEAIAHDLRLTECTLDTVAASPSAWALQEWVGNYRKAFLAEYQPDASRWIPESEEQSTSLLDATTRQAGCFIRGPSGCGKSLMVRWLAHELTLAGNICLFVSARDFQGSWAETLRRELALLIDSQDLAPLTRAAAEGAPVFILLDGLNELSLGNARNVVRGLKALARRYGGRVVITSQTRRPEDLEGLSVFGVSPPSDGLKTRIAERGRSPLSLSAKEALSAVKSGFEAEIVGEIGEELAHGITHLNLVEQFIRVRLGDHARPGALGLRRLSGVLYQRVAFSLTETEFDDFMVTLGVDFDHCEAMFRGRILARRGGRVSFSHEMFQNACAARDIAALALTDPATLGRQLDLALYGSMARDVIAAIDSPRASENVLKAITSPSIIVAAADGELGPIAKVAGATALKNAQADLLAEIEASVLTLVEGEAFSRLNWVERPERSPQEKARFEAIGLRAGMGRCVEDYLALCRAMDAKLAEQRGLLAEAARAAKVALRSEAFSLAYYGFGGRHPFTLAARASETAKFSFGKQSPVAWHQPLPELTSGELHFSLRQRHELFGQQDRAAFAEQLITVLQTRWKYEPYHVRLELLHVVGFVRDVDSDIIAELMTAIKGLEIHPSDWALNSIVVDALKILGALDDEGEGQRDSIQAEVARAIRDPDCEETRDLALSVYSRMFDHPFDSIYAEEVYGLSDEDRWRLTRRAFAAAQVRDSMSVKWLADEIAEYNDPTDAPLFARLSAMPSQTNPMSQDEMAAFVLSVRYLARHGTSLPVAAVENDAQRVMTEIRTLVYAAESGRTTNLALAALSWNALHSQSPQLVVGCLAEVSESLLGRHIGERPKSYPALDLAKCFAADLLRVCRRLIEQGALPMSYHKVGDRDRGLQFAFGVIGRHGDRSDLERLRQLTANPAFAGLALNAIRAIESIVATA
ncbi:MAG: NERD domain-containing protein [Devosia sp.]|nr:NERD domain-containing protein [Devosia sp.]